MNRALVKRMTNDDFPALFVSSDRASISAQKQFNTLTGVNLGFLVVVAIVSSFVLTGISLKTTFAILSAGVLILSILVTVIIRLSRLEQAWYDGRAVAESVKTVTWRYITGSNPYHINLKSRADDLFITTLLSLLYERQDFASRLGGQSGKKSQITEMMRQVRGLPVEERKNIYLSERIDSQRRWYGEKSEINRKSVNRLFAIIVVSQTLAVFSAIAIIIWPESFIQPAGIFVTLAAAFLAWMQMKRYQDFAQSYGLAAQELGFIYEKGNAIATDDELSAYVENAESAISREHTLWLARNR